MLTKKNILILCSGGPDSVFLTHHLLKSNNVKISLLHVNYNKREKSNLCEGIVRNLAIKYNLKAYFLNYNEKSNFNVNNFQANARQFRYFHASKIAKKINADIYTGHIWNDSLENIFIQIKRESICDYWGIKKTVKINGINVIRPLISFRKKNILKKLKKNNIKFSIDESNSLDLYLRNRIRKEIKRIPFFIQKIIYWYFQLKNYKKNKLYMHKYKLYDYLVYKNQINLNFFLDLKKRNKILFLVLFLNKNQILFNINKIHSLIGFIKKNQKKEFILNYKKKIIITSNYIVVKS